MKRKIFSKLLMGALLVASVSSFVSCKDYDDDINRLEDQINKAALQSNLEALQQKVDQNAATAASAAAAAQKAAEDAAAKADATLKSALETAIANVDTKATENGTKIANALNAIADLQAASASKDDLAAAKTALETAIAEALQAAKDAAATADEAQKTALLAEIAKVEAIANEAKTLGEKAATKDELTTKLAALNTELTGKLNNLSAKFNDYYTKSQVDNLISSKISGLQNAQQVQTAIETALAQYGLSKTDETVASQISTAITGLKSELAAAMGVEEFSQISEKFESYDTSVSAMYTALTGIELVSSYSGYNSNFYLDNTNFPSIQALRDAYNTAYTTWYNYRYSTAYQTAAATFDAAQDAWETAGMPTSGADYNTYYAAYQAWLPYSQTYGEYRNASNSAYYAWRDAAYNTSSYVDGLPTAQNIDLTIMHGFVAGNSTFGDESDCDDVENPETFVDKADIAFQQGVIVRANPVNADLTKADIVLVNSRGKGLDDYVVAGTPVPYTGLITTRATSINSGLWYVPFTIKDGVNEEDFIDEITTLGGETVLYAVAAKNTNGTAFGDDDDARYVVSTYDVKPSYQVYEPSTDFGFKVNSTWYYNIRNRWYYNTADTTKSRIVAEQKQKYYDFDSYLYPELRWGDDVTPVANPSFAYASKKLTAGNLQFANDDDRCWSNGYELLPVKLGEAFTINSVRGYSGSRMIKSYYVTLDCHNAIESIPSEINAWNSYNYTGLNKVVDASESLEITINDPAKGTANGDVIGFRVFAVNYDGTLADPDGKAFYVYVGDDQSTVTLDQATITATSVKTNAEGVAWEDVLQSTRIALNGVIDANNTYSISTVLTGSSKLVDYMQNITNHNLNYFRFNFYKSNGSLIGNVSSTFNGIDYKDAAYMTITANIDGYHNIWNLVDNGIYYFRIKGTEALDDPNTTVPRQTINFSVQKLLPTQTKLPTFITGQSADGKSFVSYMIPDRNAVSETVAANWMKTVEYVSSSKIFKVKDANQFNGDYTAAKTDINKNGRIVGFKDLNNVFYQINNDPCYRFTFKTSFTDSLKKKSNSVTDNSLYVSYNKDAYSISGIVPTYETYKTSYALSVNRNKIDGTTSHNIDVAYKYAGVSTTLKTVNNETVVDKYMADHFATGGGEDAFSVKYASWIQASTFANVATPSLQWTTLPAATPDTLSLANIKSTNTYNGELFSKTVSKLLGNSFLYTNIKDIKFVSANGQVNEYFEPVALVKATKKGITAGKAYENGDYVLTVKQKTVHLDANPIVDHTEKLNIVVDDAFGIKHTIQADVLIKRQANN